MLRILLALILLSACAPSDRNLRLYNDQTGITRTVSRDTEMFRDGRNHINARAIILEKAGQTRYHLSLSVLRGGPNGPRLLALSENEKSLCYQSHDRYLLIASTGVIRPRSVQSLWTNRHSYGPRPMA